VNPLPLWLFSGAAALLGGYLLTRSTDPSTGGAAASASPDAFDRQLTRNFHLDELLVSSRYPDLIREPSPAIREQLRLGAVHVLQPGRDRVSQVAGYSVPWHVTSGYRGPLLNAAVGGSDTSDHATGRGADIVTDTFSNDELIAILYDLWTEGGLPWLDQAITYEHKGHLHLGWRPPGEARGEFLEAYPGPFGRDAYRTWSPA
jgi:hypothetical protein